MRLSLPSVPTDLLIVKKAKEDRSAYGIRAIAEALGVSIATVDRALHGRGRISEKTRSRVLRMAEQLKYAPNRAARDLRLNRRFRVSVHFPDLEKGSFFKALQAGIEEGAYPFSASLDIQLRMYPPPYDNAQESILAALKEGVDGIIAVPPNSFQMTDLVRRAGATNIPIVCISTDAPDSGRLTAVTAYPFSCGAMAAETLLCHIKRPGPVGIMTGNLQYLNHAEKVRGFRTMLAQSKPTVRVADVIEAHDDPQLTYQGALNLLRREPKLAGLYVSTARSLPVIEALRDAGRFDEMPVIATDLVPDLVPYLREGPVKAMIYQCPEVQGSIAIQTMYWYLSEGRKPEHTIGVTPQLIIRSNLDLYLRDSAHYATLPGKK